jgi:soluble lytic murein transglycosylase
VNRTALAVIAFVLIFCAPAFAFTGLLLPFSGDALGDLTSYEQLLINEEFDQASLGLSFFIFLNPDHPSIGRAFTVLGLAYYRSGKLDQAVDAFEAAIQFDKELAQTAAWHQIKALEQLKSYDKAIERADAFLVQFANSTLYSKADQLRVRLIELSGDHPKAAQGYLALGAGSPQSLAYSQFRMDAAYAFLNAEDEKSAKKAVDEILFLAKPNRYTEEAIELKVKLDGSMGAKLHQTGLKWYAENHFRQSAPVLSDLLANLEKTKGSSKYAHEIRGKLAYALYRIHANEPSLALYNTMINEKGFNDRAYAIYRKAKLLTRMGNNEASKKAFQQLIAQHPSSGHVRESHYQIALIEMEDNNYKKAYIYFKNRLTRPGGNREYLTWLAAWCAYRSDYLDTSAKYFDRLISKFSKSRQRDRYRFWRARIYAEKKNEKSAVAIFQSINTASPMTYYGMLAGTQLESREMSLRTFADFLTPVDPANIPEPAIDTSLLLPEDLPRYETILALSRLGLNDEAATKTRTLVKNYEEEVPVLHALAGLLYANGAYYRAMRLAWKSKFYSLCKNEAKPLGQCYFSLTYPRGYPELIEGYAKKRELSPALVYALIHQESLYQPEVVSPAHAVGLMQIIPKTALQIAGELNVEPFSLHDMYDPKVNVRFGTYYLEQMLKRFEGRMPCAIASYNAGPDVVSKWMRNKGHLPDEIFIEEIPYRETNNYVKKILKNIAIYKALYNLS